MGNTVDIKLKEDSNVLEITETLIRDFQSRINLLDYSMTGFAKSIDAMRSSCELIIRHVGSNETKDQESIDSDAKDVLDTSQLPIHLLETIDESVSDYKFVVMESISKLCHSILKIGNSYTVSTAESLIELSVDKYRDQHKAASNDMQYCDVRIEVLQKEIKYLRKAYQISRSNMDTFNKREDIYQKEKNYMKKKNEKLELNLKHLKSERDILSKENSTKEIRNAEQKKEIEDLKNMSKQLESELTAARSEKYNVDEKHKFELDCRFQEIETLKEEEKILKEQIMLKDEMKTEINTIAEQKKTIQTDLEIERNKNTSLIEEKSSMNTDNMKMNREFNELKQMYENQMQIQKQAVENEKRGKEDLLERVATLEKENELSNVEKESFEQKSVKLQIDANYLKTKVTDTQIKTEALELELEIPKTKKVIHVQVYQQYAFNAPTAEEELLARLKNKLALKCVDLEIIRIDKSSHVNQDIPILISCCRTYIVRRDKTVSKALHGFKVRSKQMAVVIFNRKAEADLRKEVQQCDDEADNLGGVFNIGYKDTIYSCPLNDNNIDEIIAFIEREGHKRSKVVESAV